MLPLEDLDVRIRSYMPQDQAACLQLYRDGLLGGKLADNDTGVDIDDIQMAYMQGGGASHFWVATLPPVGQVVGMIGVQQHEPEVAEIRRLRVNQSYRNRGVGSALLMAALKHCRDRGLLRVTLDTWIDMDHAKRIFEKFNFMHTRTQESGGKPTHTFYLDFYGSPKE